MIEFPPIPDGDPVKISASTFVAYEQCHELASARLQGQYGPDSVAAFRGGLAHRVFARHLSQGAISSDEFADVCRQEIGNSTLNYKLGSLGLKPSELGRTIDEVASLYARFVKFPSEGFAGAEVNVEVEPSERVMLFGSVDAVFDTAGGTRLVDWKTGSLGDAQLQLSFYALIWALDRGELPALVEAVSVSTGERLSEVPSTPSVSSTASILADMVTDLRRIWAKRRQADRTGGPWCRSCPLLVGCSEGQAVVRLESV